MMKRLPWWTAIMAATLFAVTACGDDSDDDGDNGSGTDAGDTVVSDDGGMDTGGMDDDTGEPPDDTGTPTPDVMASSDKYQAVAAGKIFTCGVLMDGSIKCWGNNLKGQTDAPDGEYSDIAAGQGYACALTASNGTIDCWGMKKTDSPQITNPPSGTFKEISAGYKYACAIDKNDEVTCWKKKNVSIEDGFNANPSGTFKTIDVGPQDPACGITTDDKINCFQGRKAKGAPDGSYSDVGVGPDYACSPGGDGSLSCWGTKRDLYKQNEPGGAFKQVDGGAGHVCGITEGGAVECWGTDAANDKGQLDTPGGQGYKEAAAGGDHNCALLNNGRVTCWGFDMFGQATAP